MNIFIREIRANYKALFWWSIGMFLLVVTGMAKFEGYGTAGNTVNITAILSGFPKPVMAVFGMTGLDITKLIGYFGVMYLYIAIMAALHAGMLGASIISKEERDKTSEFLIPKPVSRNRVLTEKLAAAALNILVLFAVTTASSLWIVDYYNKGTSLTTQVMTLMWGILFFQLLSFAFGAVFAGLFKNPKLPAAAVSSVIMASYLAAVFADLNSKLDFLKYLTPFKYFSAAKIIADGRLDPPYVIMAILVSVGLLALTYFFYDKRDLNV